MQTTRDSFAGSPPRATEDMPASQVEHGPWHRRASTILMAVIFLPPLGVLLAWMYARWPITAKVFATLWMVFILGIAFAFFTSLLPSEPNLSPQ